MGKIYKILPAAILLLLSFIPSPNPPPSGWYQQYMPYPVGGSIRDLTFLDSLTGFAVSDSSILKTTNGGDNWSVKLSGYFIFKKIQFLNSNTGIACAGNNQLLKTTNSGENWTSINLPLLIYPYDMYTLNEDSIWLVNPSSFSGVFRTIDGGLNWISQYTGGASHIYMFNGRIGFMDGGGLKKTTDGGFSWTQVPGEGLFSDMYFVDSLTGWKCLQSMKKTTDGGFTWVSQVLPSGGNIVLNYMMKFSIINRDTIWGVGGTVYFSGNGNRGMIFRTTNGGVNWLFQIPDTTIHIVQFIHNKFTNKFIGWAYSNGPGVHTTTGGDPIWYTGIQQLSNAVPEKFVLKQNYPNPFNPRTVIPYSLSASAHVKIIAYDITGREVQRMVDNNQQAGAYEVDFMGKFTASGVYFYRMEVDGEVIDTKKMILLK